MTDPYGGNWGRIVRPGGSGMPRPMGSGLAGRMVRPMGNARGCNQWVTHRYYSATGAEIWRADHGSIVRAIAVDSSGNVYTAGGLSSNPAHYKLQKWTSSGSRVWGVLVDSDQGMDVDVDASGNIWLAVGDALEKYSPSGSLLATITAIDDPVYQAPYTSAYCPDISRVAISPIGKVVFGTGGFVSDYDIFSAANTNPPWVSGNTCDLDGSNQAIFYAREFAPVDVVPGVTVTLYHNRYDFDEDGRIYVSTYFSTNQDIPSASWFRICGHVLAAEPVLNINGDLWHLTEGIAQQEFIDAVHPIYPSGGKIAVHRPTGSVLMGFGVEGAGEIKDLPTLIPSHGTPYLQDQPTAVTESTAGHNGVLAVNDNHRYVYGVDAVGATIRVRDYPNTFLWQADHKTEVNDAIIKADNTILIGGNRVFDDCVPVGLAAVAGCTNTGIVTVYEIDGSVRWSKTLLTSTSVNHDVCFDTSGGIWARSGDGIQLVHTDPTGIIISDTAIGSIYSGGSPPAIDFGPDGVCYSNQLSVAGLVDPAVLATGPSGDLLSTPFNTGTVSSIGVTAAGKIVGWDGASFWIWSADGTLLFSGNHPTVAPSASFRAAALSPTGDYLHVYFYSTFYSSVYSGTVNLNTGVAGGGTDTTLSNVTAAWCFPSGTPIYGATSLSILPGSAFPSTIAKITGGTNRIAVAAVGKLELWTSVTGSWTRNWTKSVNSVSCDYFRG